MLLTIIGLTLLGGIATPVLLEMWCFMRCQHNAEQLRQAVEKCCLDLPSAVTPDSCPPDFATVEGQGGLKLRPANPYTGKPIVELAATAPPAPGDFRYLTRKRWWRNAEGMVVEEHINYILIIYVRPSIFRRGRSLAEEGMIMQPLGAASAARLGDYPAVVTGGGAGRWVWNGMPLEYVGEETWRRR